MRFYRKSQVSKGTPSKSRPKTVVGPIEKNIKYFSKKENIANELACRWWYVLPDWPPRMDYPLSSQNLRLVESSKFNFEPEVDSKGFKKVIQLESYPGVFQDSIGRLYDLRPYDTCPNLRNFMKKETKELLDLTIKAMSKQIEILTDEKIVKRPTRHEQDMATELKQQLKVMKQLYDK